MAISETGARRATSDGIPGGSRLSGRAFWRRRGFPRAHPQRIGCDCSGESAGDADRGGRLIHRHANLELYASQGVANEFVTAGTYSYMGAPGEFHLISGAAYVYGYSANPTDLAWHYDTAALDAFVSSGNAYSYLSGTDNGQVFFNEAVGFATTYALATHGLSIAYFIDSPGTNVFYGSAPFSYLSGTSSAQAFFDEAQGFTLVHATFSQGGTNFAYNDDSGLNLLSGTFTFL
jgi:hypothetical protein